MISHKKSDVCNKTVLKKTDHSLLSLILFYEYGQASKEFIQIRSCCFLKGFESQCPYVDCFILKNQ